ncbi:MAG: hypothetical protein AAF487_01670 [Bacteroidota bacterium]
MGQTEWEKTFGLPDSSFALDMIQVQDGDFVLYGGTNAFTENSDAFLLKFKENGDSIWYRDLGFNVFPYEGTLIEANNGDLVVCGEKIQRNDANGNEIWTLDQASVDIDEAEDGTLFSVNYDRVYKINAEGGVLNDKVVGLGFEEFIDSIDTFFNNLSINYDSIPIFNQIELINDSNLVISGLYFDDESVPGSLWEGWGSDLLVLSIFDLQEVSQFYQIRDIDVAKIPLTLKRTDLHRFDDNSSEKVLNISPSIPSDFIVDRIEYFDSDSLIYETFPWWQLCDELGALSDPGAGQLLNKHYTKYLFEDDNIYGISFWQDDFCPPFTNTIEPFLEYSVFQMNLITGECVLSERIQFSDEMAHDDIYELHRIDANNFLFAGTVDYGQFIQQGVNLVWGTDTKFKVFKKNFLFSNQCTNLEFVDQPIGLIEEQNTSTTQLKWNHYSDKTTACLLSGGTIGTLDESATFTQPTGTILVQGDNVLGDPDGFDFSPAFVPDAQFTLFNTSLFPNGISAELVPGAFYKWRVRCGCLVNPDLPLPERLQGNNVVLSPWSNWSVFENLD